MAASARQLDLLTDWAPPVATVRFPAERVRAARVPDLISQAVSASLTDSGLGRAEVARRMSDYLGEPVSVNMVNAYASQARQGHAISAGRFAALVNVTADRRLLQLLAEPQHWAVVDDGLLPMIELAAINEHQVALARRAELLRRQVRRGGV